MQRMSALANRSLRSRTSNVSIALHTVQVSSRRMDSNCSGVKSGFIDKSLYSFVGFLNQPGFDVLSWFDQTSVANHHQIILPQAGENLDFMRRFHSKTHILFLDSFLFANAK